MTVLDAEERAALEDADRQLLALQAALEEAAASHVVDHELVGRVRATAQDTFHRLNQNLPPQLEADATDEIRRRFIDVLTFPADGVPALDVADQALMETEAVRHIVRDVLQEQPPAELRDATAVVALMDTWLPGLTVRQRAILLGISERQLQRRRTEPAASTRRMQIVARLVAILRHAWTDQGVLAWFERERDDLGGRAPWALLDDPAAERALLGAARRGRVQGAG